MLQSENANCSGKIFIMYGKSRCTLLGVVELYSFLSFMLPMLWICFCRLSNYMKAVYSKDFYDLVQNANFICRYTLYESSRYLKRAQVRYISNFVLLEIKNYFYTSLDA